MHHRNAVGIVDVSQQHGLAFHQQLAAIRLMHPGDHLDQSGFPRAILAEQSVDGAGLQVDRHIRQGAYAGEGLGDVQGGEGFGHNSPLRQS